MPINLTGGQRQTYWALRVASTVKPDTGLEQKKGEVDKRERANISLQFRSSAAVNSPNPPFRLV